MKQQLSKAQARQYWMVAQGLHQSGVFARGSVGALQAIEQLGYVQIDTINVIERCHHHILFSRVPDYHRSDLHHLQSKDKSVFEYWTHALAYIPSKHYRYSLPRMARYKKDPGQWYASVKDEEVKKVLRLIKSSGPISIRDIQDDVLVEKEHLWDSRKPSKKALQLGFNTGRLCISERVGMLKKYELSDRHFQWDEKLKAPSEKERLEFLLERALRSQGVSSLDSICYMNAPIKASMKSLIENKVKKKDLVEVAVKGLEKTSFWIRPEQFESKTKFDFEKIHILSPFDPLIIQRKRLHALFDYNHIFEAYIPKEKRIYGYFALPVLMGDRVVSVIDLKADRQSRKLLVQKWTWLEKKSKPLNTKIEAALNRFSEFQFAE